MKNSNIVIFWFIYINNLLDIICLPMVMTYQPNDYKSNKYDTLILN